MKPGDRAIGIDWMHDTAVAGEIARREDLPVSQCSVFYINGYSAKCGAVYKKRGLYIYIYDRCVFDSVDAALADVEEVRAREIKRINHEMDRMRESVLAAAKRAGGWGV